MIRRPTSATRTDTLFPYTTLFADRRGRLRLIEPVVGLVLRDRLHMASDVDAIHHRTVELASIVTAAHFTTRAELSRGRICRVVATRAGVRGEHEHRPCGIGGSLPTGRDRQLARLPRLPP